MLVRWSVYYCVQMNSRASQGIVEVYPPLRIFKGRTLRSLNMYALLLLLKKPVRLTSLQTILLGKVKQEVISRGDDY